MFFRTKAQSIDILHQMGIMNCIILSFMTIRFSYYTLLTNKDTEKSDRRDECNYRAKYRARVISSR